MQFNASGVHGKAARKRRDRRGRIFGAAEGLNVWVYLRCRGEARQQSNGPRQAGPKNGRSFHG